MFEVRFDIREYEIDSQGVVNNAVYLNFLEESRNLFLREHGFSYFALVQQGVHLMVSDVDLRFKVSLRSGDQALIRTTGKRAGAKYIFEQQIYRGVDNKLCASAVTSIICVIDGKVTRGAFLDRLEAQAQSRGGVAPEAFSA